MQTPKRVSRRALLFPAAFFALGAELLAKTTIPWGTIRTADPLTVGDGSNDGIEMNATSAPPAPTTRQFLVFIDAANANRLSVMDATGKTTAIQQ